MELNILWLVYKINESWNGVGEGG